METIKVNGEELKVVDSADIVVVGGGCSGVCAAVRASRLGAKVVIIEGSNAFGGAATNGFVCVWHTLMNTTFDKQIISGLTEEIIERLKRVGNGIEINLPNEEQKKIFRKSSYANYHLNTEELKIELDSLILESGVKPYLHTMYSRPYVKDGKLLGVIVQSRSERFIILGKFFIDATADGYLGKDMGMETYKHEDLQPATSAARVFGWSHLDDPRGVLERSTDILGFRPGWDDKFPNTELIQTLFKSNIMADCSNANELTNAEMLGRARTRRMMDILRSVDVNGDKLALVALSSGIGIRETTQLKCSYQTTMNDLCYGKKFEDAICYCAYPVDIHHENKMTSYIFLDGTEEITEKEKPPIVKRWRNDDGPYPTFWTLPYRSILPEKIENLLICGRALDADKVAFAAIRVMISLNQTGEAAGVASFEALTSGKSVQKIDFIAMRKKMKEGGSIVLGF